MTNAPASHYELEALKERFKKAWQYLNDTQAGEVKLKNLPYYLVLGASHSGKTSFIKQGQLNLSAVKHLATDPQDETENKKHCNWWFCDKAVLLDIPGCYFSIENLPTSVLTWPQFLESAKGFLQQKSPAGIILTLALSEWATQTKAEQQAFIQQIRHIILLLSKQLKYHCPFYLILTKVDRINGFSEFFADLGVEEQQQIWGVNLAQANSTNDLSLPGLFKTQFDQLLKRLHNRVIWRTQHERNLANRALIQNFPWQLESLKESLANLLYQLGDIIGLQSKLPLQGVYLVSNMRLGTTVDCIPKAINSGENDSSAKDLVATTQNKQQLAYFSQLLWRKIFANVYMPMHVTTPTQRKWRIGTYAIAGTLILSSSLLMAHSFNTKVKMLNTAETAFTNYSILAKQLPSTNNINLDQVLPALNTLQQTIELLEKAKLPWVMQDFRRSSNLLALAQKKYHETLLRYFQPGLSNLLESILNNSNDPNLSYGALRIYLMLGDPTHFDKTTIQNWFANYWHSAFKDHPDLQKKLNSHLNALLEKPIPLTLNQILIAQARNILSLIPNPQLAYVILLNQGNDSWINPLQFAQQAKDKSLNKIFAFNKNLEIPSIYTAKQFQTIYFDKIITAASSAQSGDWVLGFNARNKFVPETKESLIAKVRMFYLQEYTKHWQQFFNSLQISSWKNWQQAQEVLQILTKHETPFAEILQLVDANTSLDQILPAAANLSPDDLRIIKSNLTDQFHINSETAKSCQVLFTELNDYLNKIMSAQNHEKAAFQAAKIHLTGDKEDAIQKLILQANTLPEPLKTWLNSLAKSSWRLVLDHATIYLNQTWQSEVVSYYNKHLRDRYPLTKGSKQDIELAAFEEFFSPEGVMDRYFKDYLSPFIDTSQAEWRYRIHDGQTIDLSPSLLPELERAALIRTMFFSTNRSQLVVTFSLLPMAFGPDVKRLTLALNGQTMEDSHNDITTPHLFSWPTDVKPQQVTLTFTNVHGERISRNEVGPWAFFRLLDFTNPQALENTKNFQITFDLNGYSARYRLLAGSTINPFIPGIVEGFQCPLELKSA